MQNSEHATVGYAVYVYFIGIVLYFICVLGSISVAVWPFVAYLKSNEMKWFITIAHMAIMTIHRERHGSRSCSFNDGFIKL